MKKRFFVAALAGATLSSIPVHGQQGDVERRFVAAAQARDFETMRRLLDSPVGLLSGGEMPAAEFVDFVSHCRAMNAAGGLMGWECPAGLGGKSRRWTLVGGMRTYGGKVRLSGLGDPGFPLRGQEGQ